MLEERIKSLFVELWQEDRIDAPPELTADTVLLETGFDSMAFAVFVARLDEVLGFDPFTVADEAIYPRTFGEFVAFYEKYQPSEQPPLRSVA